MNSRPKVKIVVPGGGTGNSAVLRSIAPHERNLEITAVTGTWDNGGGSGKLLEDNEISVAPGDVAQCLLALSRLDDTELRAYAHRFESRQSLINLTLAAYEAAEGGFEQGVRAFGKRIGCRGRVLTVTTNRTRLRAELDDGAWLESEHEIDSHKNGHNDPFISLELVAHNGGSVTANSKAVSAISKADIIIIPAGSFYTSILPNWFVPEFRQTALERQAPIVVVANIANECHTRGWTAHRYADEVAAAIGRPVSHLIANSGKAPDWLVDQYERAGQDIVQIGHRSNDADYELVEHDLITRQEIRMPDCSGGVERSVLRHMPHHLGAILLDVIADLGYNRQW